MSGQGCSIRHDDLIPNLTVMSHMGVSHDEILISDDGLPTSLDRASMKRHKLPDDIAIANLKKSLLPFVVLTD